MTAKNLRQGFLNNHRRLTILALAVLFLSLSARYLARRAVRELTPCSSSRIDPWSRGGTSEWGRIVQCDSTDDSDISPSCPVWQAAWVQSKKPGTVRF